jgi:signal transduction histidine kinase
MLTSDLLAGLAPPKLENQRSLRYRADEQAIELSAFAAEDAGTVSVLYTFLGDLEARAASADQDGSAALQAFVAAQDVGALLHRVRRLGATPAADPRVATAVHDIRGGALTTLFVHLSSPRRGTTAPDKARAIFLAARDHRKMMRNVVLDLDAAARARDLAYLPHSLGELARALRELSGTVHGAPVVVDVDLERDAIIAESCVEFSAIDRVAYNLLNNAVRHADRPDISVLLRTSDHDLRVTVANAIAAEQRAIVAGALAEDAASLHGAFTTTGSGHGLRIVSDLVGRAYGIPSTKALVAGGYVGATLVDDLFVSWFHWPLSGA